MSKQNKPNLFIAGAPKCGTTSMHEYLDQHPEIFMSEPKEPRYFCKDFHEEAEINNSKQYFPALTWSEYKECFDGAKEYDVIGEASPIYLYSDVAMRKIKAFNSDAKVIVMLRDPVEQMHSWYYQSLKTGNEWTDTFEEALELESERKKGHQLSSSRFPSSLFYTELARYSEQIKRMKEYSPENQIKVVLLDDLKEDPVKAYKSVLKFLEVKNVGFVPDLEVKNPSSVPRSKLINKLKNPGRTIKKQINNIFPKKFIHAVIRIIDRMNLTEKSRPDMSQATRKKLMNEHKSNVEETADLVDRDLVRIWGYDTI